MWSRADVGKTKPTWDGEAWVTITGTSRCSCAEGFAPRTSRRAAFQPRAGVLSPNLPVCSLGVIRGSSTCDADGASAAAMQVGWWVCLDVLCLRPFASDVVCTAQLAAAHAPAEAGAAKSVRGALGLAEATGERVRCFVVRCGWSMRRTFCGTSGSCAKKTVPRPSKECTSAYERQIRRIFGVSLLQLHLSVSRMLS